MNRSIIAELSGQVIPLASCTGAVNDTVQAPSLIGAAATTYIRWIKLFQDRRNKAVPERIRHFPDRGQFVSRSFFHLGMNYIVLFLFLR